MTDGNELAIVLIIVGSGLLIKVLIIGVATRILDRRKPSAPS